MRASPTYILGKEQEERWFMTGVLSLSSLSVKVIPNPQVRSPVADVRKLPWAIKCGKVNDRHREQHSL